MILFLISLFSVFHPFHVSVCDIEYKAKDKTAQISVKVFLDDMEMGLRKMSNPKIDIMKISQEERDSLMKEYFITHFSLKFDRTNKKYKYIGSEIEREALWCYIEVENLESFTSLQVRNTVLFEIYEDQVNLVNVTVGDITESAKLDYLNPVGIVRFE